MSYLEKRLQGGGRAGTLARTFRALNTHTHMHTQRWGFSARPTATRARPSQRRGCSPQLRSRVYGQGEFSQSSLHWLLPSRAPKPEGPRGSGREQTGEKGSR